MEWGPSTPINVSREHACHSETSVISLSPLLHLTGTHQSLCEIGMDVRGEASPLAPSLHCVSVSETSACHESAAASFATAVRCFYRRRGANTTGILQLLHTWQRVRCLGLTSATKRKAERLHRCTRPRSWASAQITGDAFAGATTRSGWPATNDHGFAETSKHKLHLQRL